MGIDGLRDPQDTSTTQVVGFQRARMAGGGGGVSLIGYGSSQSTYQVVLRSMTPNDPDYLRPAAAQHLEHAVARCHAGRRALRDNTTWTLNLWTYPMQESLTKYDR